MKVERLRVVVMWDCLRSVADTGNWSGISMESCTLSQKVWDNYNNAAAALPDFLDHPVKKSCGRVSNETQPVYVQSIYYVPSTWI